MALSYKRKVRPSYRAFHRETVTAIKDESKGSFALLSWDRVFQTQSDTAPLQVHFHGPSERLRCRKTKDHQTKEDA